MSFAAAPANEFGLPFGSPKDDPERASRALAGLRDPLGRDHGQSVNSRPSDKLVVFEAGGSRNQACAQTTSPAAKG